MKLLVIKFCILFVIISSAKLETTKQHLSMNLENFFEPIRGPKNLEDIRPLKPTLNHLGNAKNVSYSVSIRNLRNFHTNMPPRISYNRMSAGKKPVEGRKSMQSSHQFNEQKLTKNVRNGSITVSQFFSNKLQFKQADQLSNNISDILEKLLINYDKNERPNIEENTLITTNIHIRSMGPMSEQLMEYSLDCYFRQKWHDSRLKYEGAFPSLTLNIHMLQLIWKPDVYVINGKGSYVHEITRPNKFLRIYQDGGVYYSMRLTVKARCFMELKNFPMDKQSCPLMFGSYGYQENELKIVWEHKDPVSLANDLVMSQFDLISYPCHNSTRFFRKGRYSMIQVNFNFIRHTGYFLIQIYFPCGLIVVISWVSFWINRENTADRVGLGITSVLTLSTFGLEVSQSGPKVSYPTALNWFMIICFLFVNATLIQFSFVHYFTKIGSGELPFYYQQMKAKKKNKKKAKQCKLKKLEERIRCIGEQTRHLKESNPTMLHNRMDELVDKNEANFPGHNSNDDLILNNSLLEDDRKMNDAPLNEKDQDLELQMLNIKRILAFIGLQKQKTRFDELQTSQKHKPMRKPNSNYSNPVNPLHSNQKRLLIDPGQYSTVNLKNKEPTEQFIQRAFDQQIYCPKHNRWFSSSILNSCDKQIKSSKYPEDIWSLHEAMSLDVNENAPLKLTDKLAHSVMFNNIQSEDEIGRWTIDSNQTTVSQQQRSGQQDKSNGSKRIKKIKLDRVYSLEQQLPFIRCKKAYNQNLNSLIAFNRDNFDALSSANRLDPVGKIENHTLLIQQQQDSPSAAFKRQQFKQNEWHSNETPDHTSGLTNLTPKHEQPNTAKKRRTMVTNSKAEQFKKKDTKRAETNVLFNSKKDADIFKSNRSNEKKMYWFENIRLPKLVLQFITCIIASEDYRDHILRDIEDEHVNSVSKVDTLSKFLFPLTFILVNIVYWSYYYTERSATFDAGWKESEVFQII